MMKNDISGFYGISCYEKPPLPTFALEIKVMNILNPFSIIRRTRQEARFHPRMGALSTNVTRIQQTIFGIPIKTLHKYRETYFGEIKDCEKCEISVV